MDSANSEGNHLFATCAAHAAGERLQGARGPELRPGPLRVLRQVVQQRLAVGHRAVKLPERNVERGQRAFVDRAMFIALQRVAQDAVGFRL